MYGIKLANAELLNKTRRLQRYCLFPTICTMMVSFKLIVCVIAVMVKVSTAALNEACFGFADGLRKFGGEPNSSGTFTSQACVTCDRLLHWYDDQSVSCKSLKSRRSNFLVKEEDEVHVDLQRYYT